MAISAQDVKKLRDLTAAGMMECKKALEEADGDFDKAVEILRISGAAKAAKRGAERSANNGLVAASGGALISLQCETDFVAKNDDFLAFTSKVAELVATQNPADVAALSALPMDGSTVEAVRAALVGKIGENMSIRRFVRIEGAGKVASYIHGGSKIGVLVDLEGGDEALAKDLAMHIAANKPKSLDASGVDAALIETERRIATEKAAESGKPADIVAKMVEGTVQKFLKEVTLMGQVFVKAEDGKQTIEQLLKQKNAQIKGFTLYIVGEGIEKKVDDFAAEVAAQQAAAAAKK